jgi:hypothetical protein
VGKVELAELAAFAELGNPAELAQLARFGKLREPRQIIFGIVKTVRTFYAASG